MVRATFDLGNGSHVLIGRAYAERTGLLTDGRPVVVRTRRRTRRRVRRQVVMLRSLEIAGRRFNPGAGARSTPQPTASAVNIGVALLRHFVITTDFAARAVWLQPQPAGDFRGDAMRVIRSAEYRRMPWRNGLGETAEIAISPPGAALDQFEWRISMATIAAPGPFSAFAGIDRTLTVLSGAGFRLVLDAQPAVELTPRSAPVSFRGESEASAQLIGGPVTDLNVMTRRDRCWHRVRRRAPGARLPFEAATAMAAVFCVTGPTASRPPAAARTRRARHAVDRCPAGSA